MIVLIGNTEWKNADFYEAEWKFYGNHFGGVVYGTDICIFYTTNILCTIFWASLHN